jgi:hypothetical protein
LNVNKVLAIRNTMKRKLRHVHLDSPIAKRSLLETPSRISDASRPQPIVFKCNMNDIIVYKKPDHYIFASHQKVGIYTTDRIQTVANKIDSMLRNINIEFVFDASRAHWVGVSNSQQQTLFGMRLWGQDGDLILEMSYTSGDASEFIQLQQFIMTHLIN